MYQTGNNPKDFYISMIMKLKKDVNIHASKERNNPNDFYIAKMMKLGQKM